MYLADLFSIDVKTVMVIIFWSNLVVTIINGAYWATAKDKSKFSMLQNFTIAKLFMAASFILMLRRGMLPDFATYNMANVILFLGFYVEVLAIFDILEIKQKRNKIYLTTILCATIVIYNCVTFLYEANNMRVAASSFCLMLILSSPSFILTLNRKLNVFVRVLGLFYLLFALMLVPRTVYSLLNIGVSLFSNNITQSLTFLSLILINMLSSSVFLLAMKENADKVNEERANIDFLTKLANRYSFLSQAEQIFEWHKQKQASLAVLFFDLDKFKRINDKYGHMMGDVVLVRFSNVLRNHVGECDLACRYGGEEFVVMLPSTDEATALVFAEKVLNEMSQTKFEEIPDLKVTTSIGVLCRMPTGSDTLADYLDTADKMLYRAKESGRNRIEMSK